MMNYRRSKRIKHCAMQIVLLSFWALSANAQGICVHDQIVTASLSGRVISQLKKGEAPITRASIKLLEDRYQGRVVAQTTSDADGVFKFSKRIKPGKYVLKVSYPELATFYGPVKLTKSGSGRASQEIVVTIGADFTKPCGGSFAELRIKKDGGPPP